MPVGFQIQGIWHGRWFTHRLDGGHNKWGPAVITGTQTANYYGHGLNKALQAPENGGPGQLTFSYSSG